MKRKATPGILLVLVLSLTIILGIPGGPELSTVKAQAATRLEVWSPETRSSNITDLSFSPDTGHQVMVNVTGAGPLLGFDVTLNYNITLGPNILQALATGNELSGSLFDPNNPPAGCNILPAGSSIDQPAGTIRFVIVVTGGCTVPGTGILFTITFVVTGLGATSIDINTLKTKIIGGEPTPVGPKAVNLQYDAFHAYFRNKAGIPPVARFTYKPSEPEKGDVVYFNATESYDPEHPVAPNNGMEVEPVVYDADYSGVYDSGETVIFGSPPLIGASLTDDSKLAFRDSDLNGLWDPGESLVWDGTANRLFDQNDFVITGPAVSPGTHLTVDTKIRYVSLHLNGFWDNGHIWDFGDGTTRVPGNVTSHVFRIGIVENATGPFLVRLVVFDADDTLPMREVVMINISPGIVHDISTTIELSKTVVNRGETIQVTAGIANRGNQNETVRLVVSYDLNGFTLLGNETDIPLPSSGLPGYLLRFNYTIETSSLSARTYVVTVKGIMLNGTQVIADPTPLDSVKTEAFTVKASSSLFSLPVIAGSVVIVGILSAVYLIRRRRRPEAE